MAKNITLPALLLVVAATACGNTGTTKTEKVEGVEWCVTVNRCVEFTDTVLGISTLQDYTVADTAIVNALLKDRKLCENITIAWTLPSSDGSIWLEAYENVPLLSERVEVTEANSISSYGDDIQIVFKFSDAGKWATITRENIGQRLALVVNGHLMNAPQVNTEITSGNCAVTIPNDMVSQFLPDFD